MAAEFQSQEQNRSHAGAISTGTPEQQRAGASSHLAHDARNWLTVLNMYCDLLRDSYAVSCDGRIWIEELSNAVERVQGLVTSLLDVARTSMPPRSPVEEEACYQAGSVTSASEPVQMHCLPRQSAFP